jgi:HNH endonuclease
MTKIAVLQENAGADQVLFRAVNPLYALVAQRAGHRREYCRAPEAIFNLPFEIEHIIPRSQHGSDEESNCALACRSRNLYKSDQTEGLDRVTGEVVRILHPRQDLWGAHCRIDMETASIIGVTLATPSRSTRRPLRSAT